MNTLKKFEAKNLAKLAGGKEIPEFSPGDTLKVSIKIKEGDRERVQAYEGVCIARGGSGHDVNSSFTVRKISYGEGVERVFPLYSPLIESIELVRRGSVRRAKLYYLRDRRGKSARIAERTTGHGFESEDTSGADTAAAKPAAKKKAPAKKKTEAAK